MMVGGWGGSDGGWGGSDGRVSRDMVIVMCR